MTLLNWQLTPEQVLIFSDTLSTFAHDGRPRNFMTKVYLLPHIGAVITGTGYSHLVTSFYVDVVSVMLVDDIVQLSEFAPQSLRTIWSKMACDVPPEATTTVYTFGLSQEHGFTGFAYRSTANFEPERLLDGIGIKPAPKSGQIGSINSLEDFVKIAFAQQQEQRKLPRMQRVGIGGGLWMYLLQRDENGSAFFRVEKLCDMAHAADDHEMMLAQLPANIERLLSQIVLARDP